MSSEPLRLGVALDGAGWHPAAWREPDARPADLYGARYWVDLVTAAERALLDFVTIEDGLALQSDAPFQPDERIDRVRGRLDAVLIAARVAPLTKHIGLLPTAIVTHTEPFHLSKAIATLDYASKGRAGIRVQVAPTPEAAGHFGRRPAPAPTELFDEAADYVEVVRRLWDSWEDDAEIRDVATGRFIDRNKLHYIDFDGAHFSVKGPSITPRPPQGQPIVAALGHVDPAYELIARSTDIGFVTPHDAAEATRLVGDIAARRAADAPPVKVFGDVVVYLADTDDAARQRKARLDQRANAEYRSDAFSFVGTPTGLADLVRDWHHAGLAGVRLRPATLPHDLTAITEVLVPELQARKAFRTQPNEGTFREQLGLPRPVNRYATA